MARRLNFEKATLAGKRNLPGKDEQEFLNRGFTARWLEQAEKWAANQQPAQRWMQRKGAARSVQR